MHESAATAPGTVLTIARLSGAVDALCSAIAGFALLAGARAFTFTALLAWREPVLGGAGLVLLALVGWLRWQCRGDAARRIVRHSGLTMNRGQRTVRRGLATIGRNAPQGQSARTRAAGRQSNLKETPC
ncbi:hypothetical protein DSC91_000853 [Paraburkholderia caffeinilytica]|uniref:Uncharacterized protein n=1 Tax=Paraburkholderia caffeinilytica TaxID=1761016 RepID=A0ABQ1N822_9BURK|nr:hypothetical protein [Paraburkholderia caffeinilytica]AXL49152.1 hypothetical protein DSC91_000853 [Paraburkholderia caffeinilytica]GGC57441.1 hypothetical protein GCM10011400_51370 [Paraburkholderia caffeinilytica]CAB3804795.1 hypothetical protein LMG28690_06077 [Paraburkholderia caffeinilytica]